MQISNKLVTADFVELQKILMEDYKPDKSFVFIMKYLMNLIYALVVSFGAYFILKRFAQLDSLLFPALLGLVTFGLLVAFHPIIFRRRMNRIIEKNYANVDLAMERKMTFTDDGFASQDEKGEKSFKWTDFERMVESFNNYFLKVKENNEGFIIKADHLAEADRVKLESYLAKTGLPLEEKSHAK